MATEPFTQAVFLKSKDGIEHRGVYVRQRFYVLDGFSFQERDTVNLREPKAPGSAWYNQTLEVQKPEDGKWYLLTYSFPV